MYRPLSDPVLGGMRKQNNGSQKRFIQPAEQQAVRPVTAAQPQEYTVTVSGEKFERLRTTVTVAITLCVVDLVISAIALIMVLGVLLSG